MLTIAIRVSPASSRVAVGGRRGDALVVRVTHAAVDGRATEAAMAAVAEALGIRRADLRLLRGATSRDKVLVLDEAKPAITARLAALRDGRASWPPNR